MPPKKITLKTTQQHQKQRLDQVLSEWLPTALKQPISKGKVRKLIVAGAVYLNGRRVRIASKELMLNAQIDVYIDLHKLNSDSTSQDTEFVMSDQNILFEDEYLIAVNKPPGLPTQPTLDEARNNLFLSVKKFLAQRSGQSVTETYVGLHHRLDRDTSGILLLTKSQKANAGVADLFSKHTAQKVYQALASCPPQKTVPSHWMVKNYLARNKNSGKKAKYGAVKSGGDFAHTDFKRLHQTKSFLWIEALLHTGRTHQIRVHLSEGGTPVLGDLTYGGLQLIGHSNVPRLMLHAGRLTFVHPIFQNEIVIECPLPDDFKKCLAEIKRN